MRQDSAQIIQSLEFYRSGRLFEAAGIKTSRTLSIDGKRSRRFKTTIGTSDTTINLGDLANIGLCQFENDNPALPGTPAAPTITNHITPVPLDVVVTNVGVAGSTTVSYKVVAVFPNGDKSPASALATTTTSNATLNGSNYNTIAWGGVLGASSYLIYRTVAGGTPSTTGVIGSTSSLAFNDTGLAGDGNAPLGFTDASTWTYKCVARGADGASHGIASAAGSTSTGRAVLSTNNYNIIRFTPIVNATLYDIYRTVSGGNPATLGLIGTAAYGGLVDPATGLEYSVFNDTGLAGDGTTAPATTPFDYRVQLGSNGTLYDVALWGQDIATIRWNSAALHAKAVTNPTDIWITLIEN
jgi:hypothetical protein